MISKAIMGKKLGMTQIFNDIGEALPVTVVLAGLVLLFRKRH